jgi:bifunctional UDP-N-acetylglucosamine pyrophosphorylase / glucosamine-1-phosphate N-acetyltransferase
VTGSSERPRYAQPVAAPPTVLIMAAGHGTRMRSKLPKVLHTVCGRPMVQWVIDAAKEAGAGDVVVITRPGQGLDQLPEGVAKAEQAEGEGTGSAILAAKEHVNGDGTVLILSADHPLVSAELLRGLVAAHEREQAEATVLTTEEIDPAGYGRIVRGSDGSVERIVETKHTDGVPEDELAIREINIGTYAFDRKTLFDALERVGTEHGERYLTGVFPLIREEGGKVAAHKTEDTSSSMGINDREDLQQVERLAREKLIEAHAKAGVTFELPDSVVIDAGVTIGEDTVIGQGVTLKGDTHVGQGCEIGPHSTLIDSKVGDGARVIQSYLVECEVEAKANVGPFAYLRPDAHIGEGAKIGTFVEVKNSNVGKGTKVPHLSYLGDTDVGEEANIAAGNITANYHAGVKNRTEIGNRVKTGVDTSFVAPVRVGDGAYTGAGSVITDDVPEGALGIARPKQQNIEGYADKIEKEPRK